MKRQSWDKKKQAKVKRAGAVVNARSITGRNWNQLSSRERAILIAAVDVVDTLRRY